MTNIFQQNFLIMAKFFRGGLPIRTEDAHTQAEDFAIEYWENLSAERMFPIAYWKIKQMLSASSSKEIALRITDINDPTKVDGMWLVFEEALADSLADPVEMNVNYFILDDNLFDGPILLPNDEGGYDQVEGLSLINNAPFNNVIRGRLGKDPATGKVYTFFQAAKCVIIDIGGGSEGASTGFKVPSPG